MATADLTTPPADTAAVTSVAASGASVQLLAIDLNRLGAVIVNDSNSRLYLKYGAAASTASYTVRLEAHEAHVIVAMYTGLIEGLWFPMIQVAGSARITELTP